MRLRKEKKEEGERVLDVDASMQGTLTFKDSVNLRISGGFEGNLKTKGNLMIGEHASVNADIIGEMIIVAGKVTGKILATKELKLIAPAVVIGEITAPRLSITEGAILEGTVHMLTEAKANTAAPPSPLMSLEELSKYLELEASLVHEWANSGKLPGMKDGDSWRFDRKKVDAWVAEGKIK
jgi:excisionase family DNA binding protein